MSGNGLLEKVMTSKRNAKLVALMLIEQNHLLLNAPAMYYTFAFKIFITSSTPPVGNS